MPYRCMALSWPVRSMDMASFPQAVVAAAIGHRLQPQRRGWRALQAPGPGRFREFIQCDADTVGSARPEADAEIIALAVAGLEAYGAPLIAVDFGTATTFDVVNEKKEYLGGLITPGLKISAEALFQRASRLPRIEIAEPERLVGRNTVQAMQAGLFYGYVGQVDGILERLKGEFPKATVIATGGLAKVIAAHSRHIQHTSPDLTLEGLRILWMKNQG